MFLPNHTRESTINILIYETVHSRDLYRDIKDIKIKINMCAYTHKNKHHVSYVNMRHRIFYEKRFK